MSRPRPIPRLPLSEEAVQHLPDLTVRLPRRYWRVLLRRHGVGPAAIRLLSRVRQGKPTSWLDLTVLDLLRITRLGVVPGMDFRFVPREEEREIEWPDNCPCCGGAVFVVTTADQREGESRGFDSWAHDGDVAFCGEPECAWLGEVDAHPDELAALTDGECLVCR